MTYFYMRVPTQSSPNRIYQIGATEWLVPAHRFRINSGQFKDFHLDHLFFATESATEEEHAGRLRRWVVFHAFLFADTTAIIHIQEPPGMAHLWATSLGDICADTASLAYPTDYDHVSRRVYWPHEAAPDTSYLVAFNAYLALTAEQKGAIINWLLDLEGSSNTIFPRILDASYWQITKDVSTIELVLGHPPECPKKDLDCKECGRKPIRHRDIHEGSERAWRERRLRERIGDEELARKYVEIIDAAFDTFRNTTAHGGDPPAADVWYQDTPHEKWGWQRSMAEYRQNAIALFSIITAVRAVARYLLLDHLFHYGFFPPPPILQSAWVPPPKAADDS